MNALAAAVVIVLALGGASGLPAATGIAVAQGNGPVWTAPLGGVDASGSKRIPTAQVVAVAGLRVGTVIGPRDIDAAQQRLLSSGYFRSVSASFRNSGYNVIVTFKLEDVAWTTPVVFDNFVDQTDAQLVAAIAKDVPSFDGMAPDRDVVLKRIGASLERVMREAKDPGVVNFAMVTAAGAAANHWQFRVERASGPLPVCEIVLTGVAGTDQAALNDRKASMVGVDYSKDRVRQFARETFVPMLTPPGAAPVTVKTIDARRAQPTDKCRSGVAVTITMGTGVFSTGFNR